MKDFKKRMFWAGLVGSFSHFCNSAKMALKLFIPQQRPGYHNRKNKEFFAIEMPTTLLMTMLTNTTFDLHRVLERFSNDY